MFSVYCIRPCPQDIEKDQLPQR